MTQFGRFTLQRELGRGAQAVVWRAHDPRRDREGALRDCAARYAARLEHYARQAPDNWFNFYDYWGDA